MKAEINFDILNEVYEELCEKCSQRYWEACIGVSLFLNYIHGCTKAKELYRKKLEEDNQ